jgi:hypothetical protein
MNRLPEVVRDRILCVADITGAREFTWHPTADSGRGHGSRYKKLENLVKGAELARGEF